MISERIRSLKSRVSARRGAFQEVLRSAVQTEGELKAIRRDLSRMERARSIIQVVAQETQGQLEYRINSLVTMALSIVFDDPYELSLRFEERRGKTEADLTFLRGDEEMDPMDESGGGAVDVAAFALRVAMW